MAEYGLVRLHERDDKGDYYAEPVLGGYYFLLRGSHRMKLRDRQPIRIVEASGSRIRTAKTFWQQDWDRYIPQELSKIDLSGVFTVVLSDPKQRVKGAHFIAIANDEEMANAAIAGILKRYGGRSLDDSADTIYALQAGKRAYARNDFRKDVKNGTKRDGILYISVERIVSVKNRDFGIDDEVLRLCLEYADVRF